MAIRPWHPSSPIQPSTSLSCVVCIDFTSAFSSCFCLHLDFTLHTLFLYHPRCCCNGTNRPAAARRLTDLVVLYLDVVCGCGHRYRIRSRFLLTPAKIPLCTHIHTHISRGHVPFHSSKNLVQFPDRAGSNLGTEVSLRYTQPDCRSEATALPQTAFVSPADHPHRRELRPADRSPRVWSDGPTAALLIPVASTARRVRVRERATQRERERERRRVLTFL